tara:strand:+ start:74 stop:652 length:579 start_codon:yes stop_codon:yes gene_type:complete
MCVLAAAGPGILGLGGTVSNMFLGQLAMTAVTSVMQLQQQRKVAKYQHQAAYKAAESANKAYVDQTEALNARLREEKQIAEQQKFKVKKKVLQAKGAIRATERAGLTIDLLLGDAEREAGNWTNALNQTLQSADRQHTRNLKGLEAQRESRTNAAIDMRNQASANAGSLLETVANVANTGLTNYINYRALAL